MTSLDLIVPQIDRLILETVKEVLTEIFGDIPVMYLLLTMKESHHLAFKDIPGEPRIFSRVLRSILGKNSVLIEDLILETLYSKLELKFKLEEGHEFTEYIRDLRNQYR